jgi:hypothetical protein
MKNKKSMDLNNNHGGDSQSFLLGVFCVLLNIFGHYLSKIQNAHIPEIVMQLFQIAAWCGAIGIFIIQYKKSKKD